MEVETQWPGWLAITVTVVYNGSKATRLFPLCAAGLNPPATVVVAYIDDMPQNNDIGAAICKIFVMVNVL